MSWWSATCRIRIRVAASGINPGDLKKRENAFGIAMLFPRVIPHSEGAGIIDQLGDEVSAQRLGQRVWCFGAQSYRPFGTAAEFTAVPARQAIPLPDNIGFEAGACLGIPALTAHRAVHAGGSLAGQHVLVRGGVGRLLRRGIRSTCRGPGDSHDALGGRRSSRTQGRSASHRAH